MNKEERETIQRRKTNLASPFQSVLESLQSTRRIQTLLVPLVVEVFAGVSFDTIEEAMGRARQQLQEEKRER